MQNFKCLNCCGGLLIFFGLLLILSGSILLADDDNSNNGSAIAQLTVGIICFLSAIGMLFAASKAKRRYNDHCHHAHGHIIVIASTTPRQQQQGNIYNASYPPNAQFVQSPYPMPPAAAAPPPYESIQRNNETFVN